MENEKILEAYDALIKRAIDAIGEAPYWQNVFQPEFARLTISGELATLSWPEAESGYEGSCSIETRTCEFHAELLAITDAELTEWKVEQRAIYDRKQARRAADERAEAEDAERMAYERLKRKFGGS